MSVCRKIGTKEGFNEKVVVHSKQGGIVEGMSAFVASSERVGNLGIALDIFEFILRCGSVEYNEEGANWKRADIIAVNKEEGRIN